MKGIVFVLGAGSSIPYNLPSSNGLNNEIEQIIRAAIDEPEQDKALGHINVLATILKNIYTSQQDKKYLADFYFKFTHDYFQTIDEFLLGKSEPLMTLGKTLIAMVILYHENIEILTNRQKSDGWYGYFWRQIKEHLIEKRKGLENIKFLTFNYDRSLEAFIYHNLHSIDEVDPLIGLRKFNIDHIYGSTGIFPFFNAEWNKVETMAYAGGISHQYEFQKKVEKARECILHPKQIELANPEILQLEKRIYEPIRNAKYIFYLGCGYHASNMKLVHSTLESPIRMGTAFKMEEYQITRIQKNYSWIQIDTSGMDCVAFYNQVIAEKVEEVLSDI